MLGASWVLGDHVDEMSSCIAFVVDQLEEPEAQRLLAEGWIIKGNAGQLEPGEPLREVTESVCPVWLEYRWELRRATSPMSSGWRLGQAKLSIETVLAATLSESPTLSEG